MKQLCILFLIVVLFNSCHIYSFTGAAIEGKTINVHYIENNARNVIASYSSNFTERLRQKIQNQSALSQFNSDKADYDIQGSINGYDVSVAAIEGTETVSKNRLTISVEIKFENRLNDKNNFTQTFSRFADFNANQTLQQVADGLNEQISKELVDDIFNKAFVNW
jgi:hypothetical protein